jgi:hypothetical protein
MPLSLQAFAEILNALRSMERAGSAGAERRRSRRTNVRGILSIVPLHPPDPEPRGVRVLTIDISPESLGLMMPRPLPVTATFAAALPRGRKPPLLAVYSVARAAPIADGLFCVGSRLVPDAAATLTRVLLSGEPAAAASVAAIGATGRGGSRVATISDHLPPPLPSAALLEPIRSILRAP